MRWPWQKKEPTVEEVWSEVAKEFTNLRQQLTDPDFKESRESFQHGVNGLVKEIRETIDIIKELFH